ncbi:MAG: hypothetical protein ACR2RD_06655 [Woeseiaceae bacterium]
MNTKTNLQVALLSLAVCISYVSANPSIDPESSKRIQAAAKDKDFSVILQEAEKACNAGGSKVTLKTKSVEKRLQEATAARQCEENVRNLALAATPFESRAGVDSVMDTRIENAMALEARRLAEKEYLGLNWGVGAGISFSFDDAVDGAEIVNGVIRVTSEKQNQPRIFFEFHKYFWCDVNDGTKGCGPFVAVATTSDDVLSGVAMGWMWGWKVKAADSDGFSIGVGAVLDADVSDLADGFEANQPPPPGETVVRFESKARWSGVLFVTRTF